MLAERPDESNIPDIPAVTAGDLTMEQEFAYNAFARQARNMSKEQAQNFAIDLYKQSLVKQNLFEHLIKHKWGFAEMEASKDE